VTHEMLLDCRDVFIFQKDPWEQFGRIVTQRPPSALETSQTFPSLAFPSFQSSELYSDEHLCTVFCAWVHGVAQMRLSHRGLPPVVTACLP